MKIHLIYDKKTGEIVHTHLSSIHKEDILHHLPRSLKKENLDVLTLDELPKGEAFKIDVTSKKLIHADPRKIKGFASGGFKTIQSANYPEDVKTVYKKIKQK